MNHRKFLMLAIALLMFPQIAQTLFSPALGDIARAFDVGPQAAAQTLSVYFLAFAFGVVTWGRVCDRIGRRPSMLAGLAIYVFACVFGLSVRSFNGLLMAQALAAFGAAVGSVVTQTLLRDRFRGTELAQVFSLVGMALAASPAIGLFSGASLAQGFGYRGVLAALLLLASALWLWSWRALPETRPPQLTSVGLFATMGDMLRDPGIWRSALWIATFNVALFSYYSLGPFLFERLGLSSSAFSYSGVMLALASGFGGADQKHHGVQQCAERRRHPREGQVQHGRRQTADQSHRQFDIHKARQHILVLDVLGEVRADTHRKQVASDNGGELEHRVAQQVAGQRAGNQLVRQPAGRHHEDGQD